jgi:hypothetical protein
MSTPAELNAAIVTQGNLVRKLKEEKAAPEEVTAEVEKLKQLKAQLSGGGDGKKGGSKKATKFTLKTPKVRSIPSIRLYLSYSGTNGSRESYRERKIGTHRTCTSDNPSSARSQRCSNFTEVSQSIPPSLSSRRSCLESMEKIPN